MSDYPVFFDTHSQTYSVWLSELTVDMLKAISEVKERYGRSVRRSTGR